MSDSIKNRYDFVYYFDVKNGNPNGDPDAGNMPRLDPETGHGYVTDVCLKRKVRNYVEAVHEGELGFEMYIKRGTTLNSSDRRALDAQGLDETQQKNLKKLKQGDPELDRKILEFMCSTFFDVRTFGAVMTTFKSNDGFNCGQVRGPVQLTFAQSVDMVIPQDVSITRVAITKDEDADKKNTEFGNKYIIPYALYRCEGFVSANLARKTTGFSEDDLEVLWDALANMFDFDRSAARGLMSPRALIIFKHDSELGNAPAHKLLEAVSVTRKEGVSVPRSFADYGEVVVDEPQIPEGVEVIRKF